VHQGYRSLQTRCSILTDTEVSFIMGFARHCQICMKGLCNFVYVAL
jgi:hypothetical protein